jgi:hypothetical protein
VGRWEGGGLQSCRVGWLLGVGCWLLGDELSELVD